jgi:hypothetical protein
MALVAGFVSSASAQVITVIPSVGPSSVAASAAAYNGNALQALRGDLSSNSSLGGPASAYTRASNPISGAQLIDSHGLFNSWQGVADPGAPFSNEFGNNLYFGLQILGGATAFSLGQLVYSDNLAMLDPSFAGSTPFSFAGDQYDSRFLAFLDNGTTPGVLDAADSQIATGSSGSLMVNYLFYRGVPAFLLPAGGIQDQQRLDQAIAAIDGNGPFSLTASFCLASAVGSLNCGTGAPTGSATIVVGTGTVVPEPSSAVLLSLGLVGLALVRRRRC